MNKAISKFWIKAKNAFFEKLKKASSNKICNQNMLEQSLTEPCTPLVKKRPPHYISPITPLKIQNPNSKLRKQYARVKLLEENN